MAQKTFNSRIINKHDTEANWLKAVNFIPQQSEIIVYDADDQYNYARMKIGDGETFVSNLPFIDDEIKSLIGDTSVSEQINIAIESLDEIYAKKTESGDIIVEGEIKADNVPHTISEVTLLTIPAATMQEALANNVKTLTVDSFTHDPNVIVYATYGGKEYASITNSQNYLEFFIADPYISNGFACSFELGVDADGNADASKARFNYRVLDTENVTDLVLTQIIVSTIDSKYFDHDMVIINSLSMNRRGNIGAYSTALGSACVALGNSTLAAGLASEATGPYSIALGKGTFATGEDGFAVNLMTTAGRDALASGRQTKATGRGSFSTGNSSQATGTYAVAEGQSTVASGSTSHAAGTGTIAAGSSQMVVGKYNVGNTTDLFIIGKGSSNSSRSNAFTVDNTGNAWVSNNITIGENKASVITDVDYIIFDGGTSEDVI